MSNQIGVIHEQGDYGLFAPLPKDEEQKAKSQQDKQARRADRSDVKK